LQKPRTKVIENAQRDLNIAFMNEISAIFQALRIDTFDVLAAAGTKWNFLPFTPGLVGGHCIGFDPYYLTHRAARAGYEPEIILAARRINDAVGNASPESACGGYCFAASIPTLSLSWDCRLRNPVTRAEDAFKEHGIKLTTEANLEPAAAVILAVAPIHYRGLATYNAVAQERPRRGHGRQSKA
jgi:UDP-N-acetyl-D-galactosamine dehydrogenase